MTRVQFYGAVSLDGYLATPDDQLDWLTDLPAVPSEPGQTILSRMSTGILGRATYDTIQRLAPNAPINPANPAMDSYVLTHQTRPNQPHVTFTAQTAVDLVTTLRQTASGNIWIIGGAPVLTPLLAADQVDDLFVQIAPTLLGGGKRLFGDLTTAHTFTLTDVHRLGPLAELVYQRKK